MKIAIILPTRGHPHRCAAILTALDHLASGEHEIEYHLIVDDDDGPHDARLPSQHEAHPRTWHHAGDPAISHFARINEVVVGLDVDAISWFADDVFPLTLHWDALIALGIDQHKLPAFAWQELSDPGNVTYPVLSRKWINAVGYMLPVHFPFWFVDTWIQQLHELAFNQPFPVVQNLQVGGRRGATRGMHELAFWFKFFDATHVIRESEAITLAKAFGATVEPARMLATTAKHHQITAEQLLRVPHYEEAFGADRDPPSDRYRQLKAEAEAWLEMDAKYPAFVLDPQAEAGHG